MNSFVNESGGPCPQADEALVIDSATEKVGGIIWFAGNGVEKIDATTEAVAGMVTEIISKDGTNIESPTVDTSALGGTWTPSTKTFAAASDNSTVDLISVRYIPVKADQLFRMQMDADKGTTTGSNLKGYFLKILTSDSAKLDESTAVAAEAGTQFQIMDPNGQGLDDEVIVRANNRQNTL